MELIHTWQGRRGPVLLGPTQHRVAQHLERATKHGRVTLSMATIAATLRLERSEAYRITRQLRVLGLFGVENDQGGTKGGRRWWRTHADAGAQLQLWSDGQLAGDRHQVAVRRMRAWARSMRYRITHRVRQLALALDTSHARPAVVRAPAGRAPSPLRAAFLASPDGRQLLTSWGVT